MPKMLDKLLQLYQIRPGETLPQILAFNDSSADLFGSMMSGDLMYHYQDRRARYLDYESMDWSGGYAHVALDTYADEATSPDPSTGFTVWVSAKEKDVKQEIEELFERLHIEDRINAIARSIAKHGDLFVYPLVAGSEGIEDVIFLPPSTVDLVLHPETGKPAGYNCSALRLLGTSAAADSQTMGAAPGGVVRDGAAIYSPWDIVQFRMVSSDLTSNYGTSMLDASRQTWRELMMLETSVVIYRVHKTGQKFIFYIDVGEAAPDEARQQAERWMRSISKNRYLQVSKDGSGGGGDQLGRYLERYRPFSMHDDIYWPVRSGGSSKVDSFTVDGSITAIEDVEHFTNKLRTSFRIPKAFFDGDISGWGANKALAQQDIQFARQMIKLQRAVKQGLTRLAILHLVYKDGTVPEFEIHMQKPSYLLELQEMEVMTQRAANAAEWMGLAETFGFKKLEWARYVIPRTLGLSRDEVDKLIDPEAEPAPIQTAPDASDTTGDEETGSSDMTAAEMNEMLEALRSRDRKTLRVAVDQARMKNPYGFLSEAETE